MPVKKGDFLRLEYTGRVQETGEVFDTTDEKVAEEEDIKSENKVYGAIPIIVGAGHVLKGIEEALIDMDEGEEKTVEIPPEEGFGERDPKLMQLIPISEFRKQGIKPQIGMGITLEGSTGVIRSISGGRVRVDFNHELAGKNLKYNIKVEKVIIDDEEKIKSMITLHYPNPNIELDNHKVEIEDGKVVIQMDEMTKFDKKPYVDITFARFRIARDIWENMDNVDKVEFVDVFEKKVNEEAEGTPESAGETVPEVSTEEPAEETEVSTEEKSEPIAEEVLEERIQDKKE
ncbi:MAG TPA: peptidylprolyl isomerase [Methanobacterium sp.]|nr:peptidylprolyl isomerase [Methanobacterium sp.]